MNRREHSLVGGLVGIVALHELRRMGIPLPPGEAFLALATALLASLLPDLIEPPRGRGHRGFFHSFTLLGVLLLFLLLTPQRGGLLPFAVLGYVSHLLLDLPRLPSLW